ncbi:MAG: CrcB family protein [Bdellovibrionales bacterium]|nr:CrcB family protein [Bdellovibrionales bacterium]
MARYLVAVGLRQLNAWGAATLAVNLAGSFLIGLLMAAPERQGSTPASLFLGVGLLGGFTTFSAFGWETISLLRAQQPGLAALSVGVHLMCGLGAVVLGIRFGS